MHALTQLQENTFNPTIFALAHKHDTNTQASTSYYVYAHGEFITGVS